MNLKTKLAASLLFAACASMAQATTYSVSADFLDGGMQGHTFFDGTFDWNGTTVSNFTGLLTESMWGWSDTGAKGAGFYTNGTKGGMFATPAYTGEIYAKPGGYSTNDAPLLNLTYQLAGGTVDSNTDLVTVSTFLQNSTDVVWGGGYDVKSQNGGYAYGSTVVPRFPST